MSGTFCVWCGSYDVKSKCNPSSVKSHPTAVTVSKIILEPYYQAFTTGHNYTDCLYFNLHIFVFCSERTLSWWRNRILSTPAPPRYSTFPKSLWCYRQRRGRQVLHHAVVWPSLLGHAACPHHLGSTCLKLAAGILGDRIRIAARHKVTNYRLFANCKNVDQYVNE